jgi:hypothetical protein
MLRCSSNFLSLKIQTLLHIKIYFSLISWKKISFFVILVFELRAYTLKHSTSSFLWRVFSEVVFHKLFGGAGFKPWFPW